MLKRRKRLLSKLLHRLKRFIKKYIYFFSTFKKKFFDCQGSQNNSKLKEDMNNKTIQN